MKNMPTYLHSRKRHGPEPHGEGESHTSGNHEQVEDFVETQHSWEGIGPFASINDGLLRQQLDFNGVVITDGLYMDGISQRWSLPEAAVLSVIAGDDMVEGPYTASQVAAVVAAERDFRDYFDHSVSLLLAEVRTTPSCFQEPQFVRRCPLRRFPFQRCCFQ